MFRQPYSFQGEHLPPEVMSLIASHIVPDIKSLLTFRELSNGHHALIDSAFRSPHTMYQVLSTNPEFVLNMIAHLPHQMVMSYIRFYRTTDDYRALKEAYEKLSIDQLLQRKEDPLAVICYALTTNNIYTVPWALFNRNHALLIEKYLQIDDKKINICLSNAKIVSDIVNCTQVQLNYVKARESLEVVRAGYINFAGADLSVLMQHNPPAAPEPLAPAADVPPAAEVPVAAVPHNNEAAPPPELLDVPEELPPIKLRRLALYGANFENANLQQLRISKCGENDKNSHGEECGFYYVNFDGANLERANIGDVSCSGCSFQGANLSHACLHYHNYIENCNFKNANMTHINFGGNCTSYLNFEGANLRDADFFDTYFAGCNFAGADLTNVKMYKENINDLEADVFNDIESNSPANYAVLFEASCRDLRNKLTRAYVVNPAAAIHSFKRFVHCRYYYCINPTFSLILKDAFPEAALVIANYLKSPGPDTYTYIDSSNHFFVCAQQDRKRALLPGVEPELKKMRQ